MAQRILIVVNESVTASGLAAGLTAVGYEIAIASSGRDAIKLAAQTEPHLVLMEMELADDMGGMELASDIRQHRPIPILFMTDETEEAILPRLPVTQTFRCVMKPFTERELRLHIELALRDSGATAPVHDLEERFFAVSIDMLCCLDFNGYFKRLNPAWERTLGFTREELMSRPFIEFVHPEDRERTLKQNREVRGGGQALGFENRYLCKDGSYKWLLWNATPDSSNQVIFAVARDVTTRKRAEEEREQLVRALQSALAEVRMLQDILPICSYCKRIRDDTNYWMTVEAYIAQHTNTRFSHGICPACYENEVKAQFEAMGNE